MENCASSPFPSPAKAKTAAAIQKRIPFCQWQPAPQPLNGFLPPLTDLDLFRYNRNRLRSYSIQRQTGKTLRLLNHRERFAGPAGSIFNSPVEERPLYSSQPDSSEGLSQRDNSRSTAEFFKGVLEHQGLPDRHESHRIHPADRIPDLWETVPGPPPARYPNREYR